MVKKRWILIMLSVAIWLPVINLIVRSTALPRIVFHITYLALIICPIVATANIIVVSRIWYISKSFDILNMLVFISNAVFLIIGMKYLEEVAWFI